MQSPLNMIYWAIVVLGAFVAIWLLFVAPAEKRHHERKLATLQKKIDSRQGRSDSEAVDTASEQTDDS